MSYIVATLPMLVLEVLMVQQQQQQGTESIAASSTMLLERTAAVLADSVTVAVESLKFINTLYVIRMFVFLERMDGGGGE